MGVRVDVGADEREGHRRRSAGPSPAAGRGQGPALAGLAPPLSGKLSARALKNRILRGSFPPDCFRQVPSPSGKRHSYLVNVERYLKRLR